MVVGNVRRAADRVAATAVNALEVVRFGGLRTDEEPAPRALVGRVGIGDLRHYFPDDRRGGPAVLMVPPLMLTAEIWDVSPESSAVRSLHAAGVDPFVVDFGSPEEVDGGRDRTVEQHVLAIDAAVDVVRSITGRDVHLAGYSQGGMFAYEVAAYRRGEGIASVVTFGSPVDAAAALPLDLPRGPLTDGAIAVARAIFEGPGAPGWFTSAVFQALDPVKTLRNRLRFVLQLHDREGLLARESQRRFLAGDGFTAWPGPALAEFVEGFLQHNRLLQGGIVVGDRLVTLADLDVPVLAFVGTDDEFALPGTVRGIVRAAPRADVYEATLTSGHFGLVVGSAATERTWPLVAEWLHAVDADVRLPEGVRPMDPEADPHDGVAPSALARLAAAAAGDALRATVTTVERGVGRAGSLLGAATTTLPRLLRLERVEPDTRVSLGALLDEQAERAPEQTFFLFADRGHTNADAKGRIDAVVRGLLSVGVRRGERVGVRMSVRPSELVLVAALNRIGAVAVMLRPGPTLARELDLGGVERVVCDPERVDEVRGATDLPVLVLGVGGRERELGPGVTDLERVDPDEVTPPAWYRPNPGLAGDLAYVLFTGAPGHERANRVTNGRFALSAFGTATAGALGPGDTVMSLTPLHHPSALLTAVGGAVAAGARLAVAADVEPDRFLEQVRRYGVTVVSYTWTSARPLVELPPDPLERGLPLRLFVGSGMPVGVWRRLQRRFGVRVLEFYASTEGGAVLANVDGRKVGSKGRPLPGSAEVAVVRWDLDRDRPVVGRDGLSRRCAPNESGMLLVRAGAAHASRSSAPLRSVLEPDDAWLVTGDLFHVDGDGDHWFDDAAAQLVRSRTGPVPCARVEDVVGLASGVGLAVAYGVPDGDGHEVPVVAVVPQAGRTIDVDVVASLVVELLAPGLRPAVLRLVDQVPLTTWSRPRRDLLRDEGLPDEGTFDFDPIGLRFVARSDDDATAGRSA